VVGLEPSAGYLVRARRRSSSALLVRGRAEELPFRAGAFDTVVSSLVFCSVDDPRRALGEVRRVLAREGRLRALEHVRSSGRLSAWLQDRTQPLWTWLTGGCRPNRDTERTVLTGGFRIDEDGRRASGSLRGFTAVPSPEVIP
jgi:ubiquinone/menaquinone biosynthesis C-methylase UbiE